jgi:hypothetical protein
LIKDADFRNPYMLENYINTHRDESKPIMMSFAKSCLISVSNNQTGQGANLDCGDQTVEMLNNKFMGGERISLEPFENMDVTQCHIIKPYEFEDREC